MGFKSVSFWLDYTSLIKSVELSLTHYIGIQSISNGNHSKVLLELEYGNDCCAYF